MKQTQSKTLIGKYNEDFFFGHFIIMEMYIDFTFIRFYFSF